MAISASRYTVVTGFKDVLLVYVEGCLLCVCWIVAEKYCTKHLSKKSFLELEKKSNYIYLYINKKCTAMAVEIWLSLFAPDSPPRTENGNDVTPHTVTR